METLPNSKVEEEKKNGEDKETTEKQLHALFSLFSPLPTVLIQLIIEYFRQPWLKGSLYDTLVMKIPSYWSQSLCSDSHYLYLTFGDKYYRCKITEPKSGLNTEAWKINIDGEAYGMDLVNNILYMLKPRGFIIYHFLENFIIKEWNFPENRDVYNMTIDQDFIYFTTSSCIFKYNKEGKEIDQIRPTEKVDLCGIANDNEYLYICERHENKILVLLKEGSILIREFGKTRLKRPSSIYLHQNILYVWDFKCITVLSIENEEMYQVIGTGMEGIGNTEGTTHLGPHLCIVNNRLYVSTPASGNRIYLFE